MKVKIGNKIYDAENEPVMIILDKEAKEQIAQMHGDCFKYCQYPDEQYWVQDEYVKIKEFMKT